MTASRRRALGLAAAALVLTAAQGAQAADRALAKAVACDTLNLISREMVQMHGEIRFRVSPATP